MKPRKRRILQVDIAIVPRASGVTPTEGSLGSGEIGISDLLRRVIPITPFRSDNIDVDQTVSWRDFVRCKLRCRKHVRWFRIRVPPGRHGQCARERADRPREISARILRPVSIDTAGWASSTSQKRPSRLTSRRILSPHAYQGNGGRTAWIPVVMTVAGFSRGCPLARSAEPGLNRPVRGLRPHSARLLVSARVGLRQGASSRRHRACDHQPGHSFPQGSR